MWDELFGLVDGDEVISPDHGWFTATLEPVTPFLHRPFDSQQLFVP